METYDRKKIEDLFRGHLLEWTEKHNTEAWENMWNVVIDVCKICTKKKLKGIRRTDWEDISMDASCYVMDLISRGKKPSSIWTYCGLQVSTYLYNKEQKFWDSVVPLEEENNGNEMR